MRKYLLAVAVGLGLSLSAAAATASVRNWVELSAALKGGTNVVLGADIAQSGGELLLSDNASVTLDLNGHTLTRDANARLFHLKAENGVLTLTDTSADATGKMTCLSALSADGGMVYVEKGHLILEKGTFTGNSADYKSGGFAYVENGSVTMNGGTLADCSAGYYGGAFCLGTNSCLTMNGGVITNCWAMEGGAVILYKNSSRATINDGTIAGCSAGWGGAFYVWGSNWECQLTINGGTIANCSAAYRGKEQGGVIDVLYGSALVNGGVFIGTPNNGFFRDKDNDDGWFVVKGGVFDRSRSDTNWCPRVTFENAECAFTGSCAATQYLVGQDADFTQGKLCAGTYTFDPRGTEYGAAGLTLADNASVATSGDGTYTVSPAKPASDWTTLKNLLSAGYNVYLSADVAQTDDEISLSVRQIVTLDLNGHTLTAKSGKRLFTLNASDCELTITDTSDAADGRITRSDAFGDHGGIVRIYAGHLILNAGTFTGKTSDDYHGGFAYVSDTGRLTLNGGTLSDCTSRYGGAFYFAGGASGTINGGILTNCHVSADGGAILCGGVVTMNGGTIADCSASWCGGAIQVEKTTGALILNGGTISSCTAAQAGSGLQVEQSSVATVNGGVILNCAAGGSINVDAATATLNGCVCNDETLLDYGAERGDNWAFSTVGSSGFYVVGRDVDVIDNKISAGTFAFDPTQPEYAAAGLCVLSYAALTKNADNTYTVAVHDPVHAVSWAALRDALADGYNVTLAADIAATGTMCNLTNACAGKEMVLDLNGHTITHTSTTERFLTLGSDAAGCVLTIRDSATDGFGCIVHTGAAVATNGACFFVDAGTQLNLEGGLIANFAATLEGGAVYVNKGNVTFSGGVLSNCTATAFGAIANKGTTTLAGGVTDDASVTNAANNVTFAAGCSLGDNGAGMYVIGQRPAFSNGLLIGGVFNFNPSLPLYAASGIVLADYVRAVGRRDGTWKVVTVPDAASLAVNGGFELGTAMPLDDEVRTVAAAGVASWTAGAGASVYGTAWADANGLSVFQGDYSVLLEPGAAITQQVAIAGAGSYALTVGYSSADAAAVLFAEFNGSGRTVVVSEPDDWYFARGEFAVDFAGVCTLVLSNASATARLALDAITLNYAGASSSASEWVRVANGGFEKGAAMPAKDGSNNLNAAGVADWTGSSDAAIYGAAATNAWPCGVYAGDYALSLDGHAYAEQTVVCDLGDDVLVNANGVTGRWYLVGFSYAAKDVGVQPTLRMLHVGGGAGGADAEIAAVVAPADGSWATLSAAGYFMPVGTNTVRIVNDSNVGCAVVDEVSCEPFVHAEGELIYNGSFRYGTNFWATSGHVAVDDGVIGGVRRGLFMKNGSRIEQDFLVSSSATYRVIFALAERFKAAGEGHPSVTVTIDDETVGTYTAFSNTRFDPQILFRDFAAGQHKIVFETSALMEQALVLNAVSIRHKLSVTPTRDATGSAPNVCIRPLASTTKLLAHGVTEVSVASDATLGAYAAEDFATDSTNDYFRLEAHAGAYAHPEYAFDEPLELVNGLTFSVGGVPRGHDGPILTANIEPVSKSDDVRVIAFESADNGSCFALKVYSLTNGVLTSATNLFSVSVDAVQASGKPTHLVVSWLEGVFSFYVNGHPCGSVPFTPITSFLVTRLRLGAFPEGSEAVTLGERRCATFDLADARIYAHGLSADEIERLSGFVCGECVNITLYDAATDKTYGSHARRVGAVYGALASYEATRPGYAFLGWNLAADGSGDVITPQTVVTEPTDHRLYAQWSNNLYRVTYDFAGYPLAKNTCQDVVAGSAYELPAGFEIVGVNFYGWTNANGQVVSTGMTFPADGVYADETLYAHYDNAYGPITFDPHNGDAPTVCQDVLVGSSVAAVAPEDPVRDGYTFQGWFSAENGGSKLTDETLFSTVAGETWHAHWRGDEQTVTWRAPATCLYAAQTTVSRSGEAYALPENLPVCTNGDDNVRFYGWGRTVNGALETIAVYDWNTGNWSTNTTVTTWTNAHDAVALWWQACAFDPNGGLVATDSTWLYPGLRYDAAGALPTPSLSGFTFDGWSTNGLSGATILNETIVPDPPPTNLVAVWRPLSVKVTLDANGGTNEVDSVIVTYNAPYGEFPTPTRPGYALDSWHYILEDGAVITPETIVSNADDHSVIASWTNAWFTMQYVMPEYLGGKVLGKAFRQRYENPWQNLYVPTQAEIGEHWVFEGWMLEETDEFITEGDIAKMTRNGNLVALVSGEACTFTLDAVDGVLDADYKEIQIEYGCEVEGLPEADDIWRKDCEFLGWYTQAGDLVQNGDIWETSGTTALQAKWRGTVAHTITYESNTSIEGAVATERQLCYGDALPTVPKPERTDDATFLGWYYGDVPCTDADGKPLADYATCPWETDTTLVARWAMPRDAFAQAATLMAGVTNTVIGVDATDEPDEPNHDLEGVLRATHWYKFEGTAGKTVRIVFEDLTGLEPMVQIVVYKGTCLEDLEEVDGGSLLEMDNAEAVLEWTLDATATYYVALAQGSAQDNECAALSAYRVSAMGVNEPEPTWESAWTDPSTMPGNTQQEKNENALLNDGFDAVRANRLSPTNTYKAFTAWAGIGNQETEISPEYLNDKTNVILAAAYNLATDPSGTISVIACETTTNAAGEVALRVTLKVTGDFTAGDAPNADLLKAALGVKGSTTVDGTYSAGTLTCEVEAVDKTDGTVRVLVTPDEIGGAAPTAFFVQGVTY